MELKLLDTVKYQKRLQVNHACDYTEDGRMFIINEAGIFIVELKCDPGNPFLMLSCKRSFISPSNYVPCADVGIDINQFHLELPKDDLYETICRLELSASLKQTKQIEFSVLSAHWSATGMFDKSFSVLGVINNLYGLELYVKIVDKNSFVEYVNVLNVSKKIIEVESKKWKRTDKLMTSFKYNEYIKRVESILVTAIAWGDKFSFNGKNYCSLFIGHMNGVVTVWRLEEILLENVNDVKLQFLGEYKTDLGHITSLHWWQTKAAGGGLSIGELDGRMSLLHISNLDKNEANFNTKVAFLSTTDNIQVDKILVFTYETYTFLVVVKHCYLIIFGISEDGEVFDRKILQVSNTSISGINQHRNKLFVLSLATAMKEFTLSVSRNEITVAQVDVQMPSEVLEFRMHGLICSQNRAFWGILATPYRWMDITKNKYSTSMFIFQDVAVDPFQVLWNNTSGSLRSYWDCFEVLRLTSLKDKRFPWIGIPPNLNYDELSLLQLKTLRIIAKMSETIYDYVPSVDSYEIKPYILLHYMVNIKLAVNRINKLLSSQPADLTVFQLRSVDLLNFFLKEMVAQDVLAKANLGITFVEEIYKVMSIANEISYPDMPQCYWCGEKILGSSCLPPHTDSRCSISLMPMYLIPGYQCPQCKSLAHKELEREYDVIICVYCDLPMKKFFSEETETLKSKEVEELETETEGNEKQCLYVYNFASDLVTSDCFDDCLKDDSDVDVGDNDVEFVILSDDESAESEELDKKDVKELYLKMQEINISVDDN